MQHGCSAHHMEQLISSKELSSREFYGRKAVRDAFPVGLVSPSLKTFILDLISWTLDNCERGEGITNMALIQALQTKWWSFINPETVEIIRWLAQDYWSQCEHPDMKMLLFFFFLLFAQCLDVGINTTLYYLAEDDAGKRGFLASYWFGACESSGPVARCLQEKAENTLKIMRNGNFSIDLPDEEQWNELLQQKGPAYHQLIPVLRYGSEVEKDLLTWTSAEASMISNLIDALVSSVHVSHPSRNWQWVPATAEERKHGLLGCGYWSEHGGSSLSSYNPSNGNGNGNGGDVLLGWQVQLSLELLEKQTQTQAPHRCLCRLWASRTINADAITVELSPHLAGSLFLQLQQMTKVVGTLPWRRIPDRRVALGYWLISDDQRSLIGAEEKKEKRIGAAHFKGGNEEIERVQSASLQVQVMCWQCQRQMRVQAARVCSRCQLARYCGEECAKVHVRVHQQLCKVR